MMVRSIAKAYQDAYRGLPTEVWVLSVALFVNRCGSMVLAFLTLYLTNKLGFKMFESGAIFSVWGIGSLVGSYLGGKLIKPLGAIPTQIVGLLLAVPLLLVVPLFTSWWSVALIVFLFSVSTESVRPANHVAVAQFTEPELMTRAFGLQRMAVNLGFAFGPVIGGLLAEIDYVWLFVVDAMTTGLGGVILIWHFGFRKYAKDDEAAKKQKLAEEATATGSPLHDLQFMAFLFLILIVGIIFFQFHATYPKYLEEHYSLSKPQIGFLFSVNTVIIVVLEMILLDRVKSLSLLRVIGWGGFLSCLGFGVLPFGQALGFSILSMTIITFGEMFMFPLGSGFVAERSNGRDQSAYMSWYAMNFSLAAIIAPIIGTSLYEHDPELLWYISLIAGLVVLLGFYILAERIKRGGNPKDALSKQQRLEQSKLTEFDKRKTDYGLVNSRSD
jgi:MFS family permease